MEGPILLTRAQAAKALGISLPFLDVLRARREGPDFVAIGRRVAYRREDLDRWVASRVVSCASPPDR